MIVIVHAEAKEDVGPKGFVESDPLKAIAKAVDTGKIWIHEGTELGVAMAQLKLGGADIRYLDIESSPPPGPYADLKLIKLTEALDNMASVSNEENKSVKDAAKTMEKDFAQTFDQPNEKVKLGYSSTGFFKGMSDEPTDGS